MAEKLRETLNWACEYNEKLKSPIRETRHEYHIKDMLNVIKQIYDGTFDDDLVQISRRVDNIERMSRQRKCIDPWLEDDTKINKGTVSIINHPYLKKSSNSEKKDKLIKKNKEKSPVNNKPKRKYLNIIKQNLKETKNTSSKKTDVTNTSFIPLHTDYMSPINILPLCNTNLYHIHENLPECKVKQKRSNTNNHTFINPSEIKKPRILHKAKLSHIGKNQNNFCTYTKNDNKRVENNRVESDDSISNGYNEKGKDYTSYNPIFSNEESLSPVSQSTGINSTSNEIFSNAVNDKLNDSITIKYSQGCQTLPYESTINILKPEDKLDMRKFLTLYNISIDPEFMEEELERFSLRLYERISYYIEKDNISLNIDDYTQQILSDQIKTSARNEALLDLEQDSCNSIKNDISIETPNSTSDKLLESVVNAFKNTSFHDLVKTEVLSARKNNKAGVNSTDNIARGTSEISVTDSSCSNITENSKKPVFSHTISEENQSSVNYSEDFAPLSISCSQTGTENKEDSNVISAVISSLSSNVDDLGINSDKIPAANPDVDCHNECILTGVASESTNISLKPMIDPIYNEIDSNLEHSHVLLAENSCTSIQKDSMNISEGELIINISDSLKPKEREIRFGKQDASESPHVTLSDLSVIANDCQSFETGKIQILPDYPEDATLSSGELFQDEPHVLQFKTEEIFNLYKENEILRQRLSFIKRT